MRALGSAVMLLGVCVGVAPALRAATSFNFSDAMHNAGVGTIGNSLTFSPGITVTANAWSTTGTSDALAQAALGQYYSSSQPLGLGVCASTDYVSGACTSPQHAADNVGDYDFILLTFSQPLYLAQFTLDVFGQTHDTDVTYFAGNCVSASLCSPSSFPSGLTTTTLLNTGSATFGGNATLFKSGSYVTGSPAGPTLTGTQTTIVNLTLNSNQPVNWILFGASTSGGNDDYFKINSMTYSTTPEPATFGLAGIALAALGYLRRRKTLSSNS